MNRKPLNCKDPILKKKSQKIQEITLEIKDLCLEMSQTLAESQGVGLAAPQIGELKRIILVQTENGLEFFINPVILKKSWQAEFNEEGCLNFPGVYLKIKRAKKVEVEALNLEGEKIRIKAQDLTARIFQHEIDHLNGILIVNRINFWEKLKIKIKGE